MLSVDISKPGQTHLRAPQSTSTMDARLSPVSSSSESSEPDDELFEGEQINVDEPQQPLSPPPESSSSRPGPSGSNKRRAPGGPVGQPSVKSRNRRGEDSGRSYNNNASQDRQSERGESQHAHRSGRGAGPEGRREDILDHEYAKYLRRGTSI